MATKKSLLSHLPDEVKNLVLQEVAQLVGKKYGIEASFSTDDLTAFDNGTLQAEPQRVNPFDREPGPMTEADLKELVSHIM